jgi:hypothetical protein
MYTDITQVRIPWNDLGELLVKKAQFCELLFPEDKNDGAASAISLRLRQESGRYRQFGPAHLGVFHGTLHPDSSTEREKMPSAATINAKAGDRINSARTPAAEWSSLRSPRWCVITVVADHEIPR